MGHSHSVRDSNAHFMIDPVTMIITYPEEVKPKLVQGNHNSEVHTFEMPRFIEGHDMMLCNLTEIHYNNINSSTKEKNPGVYEVKGMRISEENSANVLFEWKITEEATVHAGLLYFAIKFKCIENGVKTYEKNTEINTDITVSPGMDNSKEVTAEPMPDILAQWKEELFGAAGDAVVNVNVAREEALAAVRAEGVTQVENVKAAAAEIVADREQIHKNNATKAVAIMGSAEGEVILLDDSAEQPLIGLNVFGKSGQATTTGKNKVDLSGLEFDDSKYNHEFTTANASGVALYEFLKANTGKTVILSVNATGTPANVKIGQIRFYDAEASMICMFEPETPLQVPELPDSFSTGTIYGSPTGAAVKNIQIEFGEIATEYEPYTGGIPSPNPEYPQEINSVENPEVVVRGKNLVPYPYTETTNTKDGITFTDNGDGSITMAGTSTKQTNFFFANQRITLPKGTYTVNFLGDWAASSQVTLWLYDTANSEKVSSIIATKEASKTFTITEKKTFSVYIVIYSNTTMTGTISVQLEVGENATDYEPYKEPQTLSLPRTLHGIPVTSGGNYTDADGQQWICDEVDLERGVLIQRIKETSVNIASSGVLNSGYVYGVFNTASTKVSVAHAGCISERAKRITTYEARSPWCFYENEKNIVFIGNSEDTLETLQEKYNGSMVMYVLAEPIETPLSDAEIEAFRNLMANYPTTTILNDSGANMAVRYGIDTKTYIDKMIAEAIGQVISS